MINIFKNLVIFSSLLSFTLSGDIRLGIDVFENEYIQLIRDKRIALLINHTSLNSEGKHIIDIVSENNLNLVKIFAPEHGYLGNHPAGQKIKNNVDPITGCEVVSLYGKNKAPTNSSMADIDVLIFDIQDNGIKLKYMKMIRKYSKTLLSIYNLNNYHKLLKSIQFQILQIPLQK